MVALLVDSIKRFPSATLIIEAALRIPPLRVVLCPEGTLLDKNPTLTPVLVIDAVAPMLNVALLSAKKADEAPDPSSQLVSV